MDHDCISMKTGWSTRSTCW